MGKDSIVLIDTSSWIEALRTTGKREIRERVLSLMVEGRAAWCDMIAIELWNGARGEHERQKLSELDKEITCLQITQEVWQKARVLAQQCRSLGQTVPSADLVIAACALSHHVSIEHQDEHIDLILKAASHRRSL